MTLPLAVSPAVDSAVSKIFRRVVPLFIVMLICNQLNRSNIGYAQTHLEADVGIGAAAYGFGAGVFFIAYAIFELPSNVLMEKFGAKVWLTRIMISWGLVSAAMAFVNGPEMFYALRFLLGVAEAGFFPAIIFYFTRWLPNNHRSRATALFIAGSSIAAAISGPLSGPLLSLDGLGGHHGWQWMFALEGLLSVVVGCIAYRLLDSKIDDAKWLTGPEKHDLQAVIAEEDVLRSEASAKRGESGSRWKLLLQPRILVCCGIFFAITMRSTPTRSGSRRSSAASRAPPTSPSGCSPRCRGSARSSRCTTPTAPPTAPDGTSPTSSPRCSSAVSARWPPHSSRPGWRFRCCASRRWDSRARARSSGPFRSAHSTRWCWRRRSRSSTRWATWVASWPRSASE